MGAGGEGGSWHRSSGADGHLAERMERRGSWLFLLKWQHADFCSFLSHRVPGCQDPGSSMLGAPHPLVVLPLSSQCLQVLILIMEP